MLVIQVNFTRFVKQRIIIYVHIEKLLFIRINVRYKPQIKVPQSRK